MPEVRSPTLRRRELGALLRSRRLELGLTVEQVAERLMISPSKVSRMETGQRGATQRDVRDLCTLYGITDEAERDRLMTLAREGKQQGWWQPYALPYATFIGLEQAATSIKIYHSAVVPGVLQTADYTRAVHRAAIPRLADEVIEERVEERSTRQQLLTGEHSPLVDVMLDEAVLHRPVGGRSVMRDQLDQIISASDYPNVAVQILPYDIGAHPALESDFTILGFESKARSIVYVEGLVGQIYVERQQEVERYQEVFERLHGIALGPKDSNTLLRKIRETYANGLAGRQTFANGPRGSSTTADEWARCPLLGTEGE